MELFWICYCLLIQISLEISVILGGGILCCLNYKYSFPLASSYFLADYVKLCFVLKVWRNYLGWLGSWKRSLHCWARPSQVCLLLSLQLHCGCLLFFTSQWTSCFTLSCYMSFSPCTSRLNYALLIYIAVSYPFRSPPHPAPSPISSFFDVPAFKVSLVISGSVPS